MSTRFPWKTALALLLAAAGTAFASEPGPAAPQPSAWPAPPPVVPYEKLIAFLPEPPAGWTAERPSGSTADIEVFKLSTATRTYIKGEEDDSPITTVTIIDAGGHQGYFDITTKGWKTQNRTADGYDIPIQINGMPGYEHSSVPNKSSSLWVVVGKRYFVQIEVANQEPNELREWLKRIDLKKLAELK